MERRRWVDLSGACGLLAVLAFLVIGLPAIDDALPSERPVTAGLPIPVGGGITVVPPTGATLDVTVTRPGEGKGSVLLRLGPVRYAITVQPFDGTLAAAADRLRHKITGTPGYQVTGTQMPVRTDAGVPGLQGGYTAPGRGGRYSVFLIAGCTVEVTVSGTELDLGRTLAAIDVSTKSLVAAE